ncbi:rhodanese-like domain-containing protein 6 isoform X1 [Asparagus officinalis]|uniref:rhodanese-like domain-containing protein 6 isoform X1 n=1 Tax=Asparagus officinalis TaxID=4686 RepID=UPI00098E15DE|nr:rhodanese-like domain-containing protein 6 isoform X1 [Asparagus officinalis]
MAEPDGVLLYYKYAPVPDVAALVRFYESNCRSLGLLGRVRVAPDGVNVTVGGKMPALEKHIEALRSDSLFEGTDFKLASCDGPSNERIARECGFTDLSVRVVKELVTFRSDPLLKPPEISHAGKHLSATEFHSVLQDAAGKVSDSQASTQEKQLLLLDARNLYETRIGKFQNPDVETLDPEIRQYSDLPSWIDEHAEQLQGKNVLMYCTGGIRCEMASAYIRSKGAGYENVFQLYGGIQRYLEQFPDGGFFKGKNFVFDHRVSVGSQDTNILGACLICGSSFDDYSSRCRCSYCRMLVLVCYSCQGKAVAEYVCELCKKHCKGTGQLRSIKDDQLHMLDSLEAATEVETALLSDHVSTSVNGNGHHRKLRILCLHGFRQNASNFKGRTASLAKKLKNIAEFVLVNAPHELPFIYHASTQTDLHQTPPPSSEKCKKRFAWLISSKTSSDESGWKIADEPFDPLQYQQQTEGFEESYKFLKNVISELGPFDGILGFSQGSAMAALFLEQQQRIHEKDFRFAILCSGFNVASEKLGREIIRCPSLHIFGDGRGRDRQIDSEESRKLVGLFDEGCSVVIEHDMGHIIPTMAPYIDQMKGFLQRFM